MIESDAIEHRIFLRLVQRFRMAHSDSEAGNVPQFLSLVVVSFFRRLPWISHNTHGYHAPTYGSIMEMFLCAKRASRGFLTPSLGWSVPFVWEKVCLEAGKYSRPKPSISSRISSRTHLKESVFTFEMPVSNTLGPWVSSQNVNKVVILKDF